MGLRPVFTKTLPLYFATAASFVLGFAWSDAIARDDTWAVSFTGGWGEQKSHVSFYESARALHRTLNGFKIPENRRFELFGDRDRRCYRAPSKALDEKITAQRKKFLEKPGDCSRAQPIFDYLLASPDSLDLICDKDGEGVTKVLPLGDLGEDGKEDLKPATRLDLELTLKKLQTQAKNAHLILNLNDHGDRDDQDWYVETAVEPEKVGSREIQALLQSLRDAGITVHLNVQACFSGGFHALTQTDAGAPPVCVTASTDPKTLGYTSDALFKDSFDSGFFKGLSKYGNHLQAFACALGATALGYPESSLDALVSAWEKERLKADCASCETPSDTTPELATKLGSLSDSLKKQGSSQELRAALIDDYRSRYLGTLISCGKDLSSDEAFAKKLTACITHPASQVDSSLHSFLGDLLGGKSVATHRDQMVRRQARFLKNADPKWLERFKNAYCCLAHDFTTGGKGPALCGG